MFGMSKDKPSTAAATLSNGPALDKDGGQTTIVAKGTVIEGKFNCPDNVRLDGEINGEVRIDKRLVMGENGKITGNTVAKDAIIKGRIQGDIIVKDSLQLTETAVIEGNISAKTMIVEEGAKYNGKCQIGDASVKAATKQLQPT